MTRPDPSAVPPVRLTLPSLMQDPLPRSGSR